MQSSPRDHYLETDILTATPQKQQLMLIEAAIRLVERTRRHWQTDEDEEACQCLVRAQQIITELLSSLNHEVDPQLTRTVAALYVFVFRSLVDANLSRDQRKLDEALRVLEPQREAWQGVCKKLGSTAPPENEAAIASLSPPEPVLRPPSVAPLSTDTGSPPEASAGFSVEA